MAWKKCPHCESKFRTPYPDQIYCSAVHLAAAYWRRKRARLAAIRLACAPVLDCANPACGNTFKQVHYRQKYCSPGCCRAIQKKAKSSRPAYREARNRLRRRQLAAVKIIRKLGLYHLLENVK